MVKVLLGDSKAHVLTSKELKARITERKLLAKPSLQGLVYLLRHKELWPEGFKWNWTRCEACAMGLAATYWGKTEAHPHSTYMEATFGLTQDQVMEIFCSEKARGWLRMLGNPSPKDIARHIEKRLLKGDKT